MMRYSFEECEPVLLDWKGVLTREMAVDLRKELIAAMRDSDQLTINLALVEAIDVSCLLLLCAAKRYADSVRQRLTLEGTENPAVGELVERYGYGTNRFCLAQCNGICLWIKPKPCQRLDGQPADTED